MKKLFKKLIVFFIFSCILLSSYYTNVSAEETSYIYFDLSAGNVTIESSKYTGYIYETTGTSTSVKTITGTHVSSNKYYVYQSSSSNRSTTGMVNGEFILPIYSEVMYNGKTWSEYITNNTNVTEIVDNWNSSKGLRESTSNKILVSGAGKTFDLTIDNIWSTYQSAGSQLSGGGISVNSANTKGTHVVVRIKGDNRLGSIRYYSTHAVSTNTSQYSSFTLTSFAGDGETSGSLTVIGNQKLTRSNGNYTAVSGSTYNVAENHWDSVIGGTDSYDSVRGLYIKGATIYSGSTARENCTAIGGGGNGIGNVIISGGNVTAVSETTGTAIGGGIAHTSYGGTSDITISGGEVYAYNFGQPARDVIKNFGSGVSQTLKDAASHIAGTAIGGASSILNAGNQTTAYVKITGGKVYAESLGGCGIGAGNSVNTTAGSASVTISGGEVTAKSVGKTVTFESGGEPFTVKPGVSIGGGSGGINGNGGSATINISGGTIKTGSIGGGSTRSTSGHNIGYADITISGGDVNGQFIMVKGGTSACKFNMTGGTVHDSDTSDIEFVRLQENGGAVYMDDPSGIATISGGTIESCSALNGGAIYMTAGQFVLSDTGQIKNCSALNLGGAIFLGQTGANKGTFTMNGGSISNNKAPNGDGGALYLDDGNATVTGGTIELNEAQNGGGAYLAGGTLVISNGLFKENKATSNGGGAFYLNGGNAIVTGGSIELNEAQNGGGAYIAGGELDISNGLFSNNKAAVNGGGAFVEGGNITMSGGSFDFNRANDNGGGIYLTGGSLTMNGGSFKNNSAVNDGGGAYVSGGDFELNGDNASFNNNYATNGGGVYLTGGKPNLYKGLLIGNIALKDGGGIYIDKQQVTLVPKGEVLISQNKAGYNQFGELGTLIGRGAGIFIGGESGAEASFSVSKESEGVVLITGNQAKDFGGGVCINRGNFLVDGSNITVGNNSAINGGGVAVLAGNFNLSAGTIGGTDLSNSATNGGGVYVSGGNVLITGEGTVANNKASENGGGVCVANGNVTMIGGLIDKNIASNGDGGGIYVSADGNDVKVQIISGSITNNNSSSNGGAVSVMGSTNGTETITVIIGVDKVHYDDEGNRIDCEHKEDDGTIFSLACPVVEGNQASGKGGAIYITGGNKTYLNIYCLIEEENVSLDDNDRSNFMMVEGGTIVISTCEDNDVENLATHGNSVINDSLHVVAGSLDIYGSMDNPKFKDSITVNITKEEDHFGDHRKQTNNDTKYFKLQYFENFKDPESGVVTGEYTVYQYAEGEKIEISGVVFSHLGYEIVGWFTEKDGTGTKYEVGQEVVFGTDVEDLLIYAIWTAHSYYVEFNPNIPDGVTYEGNMSKLHYTYNTEYNLPLNNFVYSGYVFNGWVASNGKTYKDGQKVINLTNIDGATILLTAQWVKCNHDINNTEFNVYYIYTSSENVLTKTCSCKGHSETVTINASNYTYDGFAHHATLKYSDKEWLETLTIIYLRNGIQVTDPINAGDYEVKVSYNSTTATAEFVIYKADQSSPNKPSFIPEQVGANWNIIVNCSPLDDSTGKLYEYRLSYYSDNDVVDLDWQDSNTFSLPIAFTNYLIYIRYAEDENHNPSEEVRADQMYYYSPEISIIIDCCDGFFCTLEKNGTSGLNIIVTVLDGYYKSSQFIVTAETRLSGSTELSAKQAKVKNNYTLLDEVPSDDNYVITLIVRGAEKSVNVSSYITENKVFTDINTLDATISRDSAFTTYFNVSNYDKYEELSIKFNEYLPKGTSIILIDKSNNSYWYFNFNIASNSLLINDFIKMGEITKFNVSGTTLKYQFIVDFSKVEETLISNSLSVYLDATAIEDGVPDFSNGTRTVNFVDVSFEINDLTQDDNTSEKEFETKFADTDFDSSKWDNRGAAILVTPNNELPYDTRIKISQDNKTTYYYQNELQQFIIPIKGLKLEKFVLSLESNLFPESGESYDLNIKFYASNSNNDTSILNGEVVAEINSVIFKVKEKSNAAVKITGEEHIIRIGQELTVNLDYILPDDCTISSDLMVKAESGEYTSSGKRPDINSQGEMKLSLAGLVEGNYCFRVIIKDSDGITIMSVPYYFIIVGNDVKIS